MRKCLALILLGCFLIVPSITMRAQSASQTTLIALLESLSAKHQVRFSYNADLLRGLSIPQPNSSIDLARALTYLSNQLPITFKEVDQGNYSIIPVRKPLNFKVNDAADQAPIELVYVTVNGKKQVYLIPNNGTYSLSNSFSSDSLEIRTSFYTPVHTTAHNIARNGYQVYLTEDTVNLGEVTILSYLTSGVNSFLGDHRVEIDMSELGLIAGETDGDIFQVLQAIPGIRSPNGKPGSLNFRGSPFSQNLTLFDNIPIYHTGHFFGTFSPYNPGIVDRISVYRGVLPSRYGGRVGGLIDVQTSDQVPDSTKVSVLANTVIAGAQVETPVASGVGLYVSFRANYPIDYLSPKLQAYRDLNFQGSRLSSTQLDLPGSSLDDLNIRFSDFTSRLIFDIAKKHKLSFSYLNIGNSLDYDLNVPRTRQNQTHENRLNNEGFNIDWRGLWSERFSSSLSFTNSSFSIYEDRQDDRDQQRDREITENAIDDTRFNALFNLKPQQGTQLTFGYEYTGQEVIFEETQTGPNAEPTSPRNGDATIHSAHLSLEQELASKLVLNAGLHFDAFSSTDQQFLDPRVSLTYLASKALFLKASGGRSHQYIRQSFGNDFDDFRVGNQFWILVNRNEQVVAGRQFMLGALYEKSDWLLDFEIYVNNINNINRVAPIVQQQPEPDILGDLETIGADFLVKKRWPQFETWLSYTWGNTEEIFNENQGSSSAYYDQRHVLNVKWLYPRDRWSLALSWNMMSGLPVRTPRQEEIDNPDGPDVLNIPYSGRFPVQHQMDLSATYQFSKPGAPWRGVIGLSIMNVYNRQNVINVFQQNVITTDAIRYGLGFAPNLQVKFTF